MRLTRGSRSWRRICTRRWSVGSRIIALRKMEAKDLPAFCREAIKAVEKVTF